MRSYEDLEAENAELRERLVALTGDWPLVERVRAEIGASTQEARVFVALMKARTMLRTSALYAEVFQDATGDGPEMKIVSVVICNLRRKLRERHAAGAIETVWGSGYAMTQEMKTWIQQRLDGPQAVAA